MKNIVSEINNPVLPLNRLDKAEERISKWKRNLGKLPRIQPDRSGCKSVKEY